VSKSFGACSSRAALEPRHGATVTDVVFSPDDSMLASRDSDGSARVWALDIDDLLEIARQEVTRSLIDEECRQYLHLETCSV
jgi:WD40 repeat protein